MQTLLSTGVLAAVMAPLAAAAQTPHPCAAPRALAAKHELAAAQASYERLLLVDAPPACAGAGLAGVLAKRAKARGLFRDGRATLSSDRQKARDLYERALAIDAGLSAADDALAALADERTLHDVGKDVGSWAARRTSDLGNAVKAAGVVLGALLIALSVLALVGAVVLRIGPVKQGVRRAAWNVRRVSLLAASPWLRYPVAVARWLMKPFAWATGTPLQVDVLKAPKAEDGAAVSQAIAGLLPTVTTRGTGGVALVVTPFAAKTALEEVSDVLSGVPQGNVAAAALKLARRALPRDHLRLCGACIESATSGPGLALSLVDVRGNVFESAVLWASGFDPWPEPGAPDEPEDARTLRLAWAAAVWAEFTALSHHGALGGEDDWRRHLGTRDWRSYALLLIAVSERGRRSDLVTQATYARALDRDPHNVHALVNLANIDLDRADYRQAEERFGTVLATLTAREDVPGWVRRALRWVGRLLKRLLAKGPPPVKRALAKVDGLLERIERRRCRLLTRDPLRYQAAYGLAVAQLGTACGNDDFRTAADALKLYVVDLERALLKLDGKRGRDAAELYAFLRRMEGPLLVLWAYLEARFNAKSESPRTACERNALVEEFDAGTVRHDRLVRDFVLEHVEVGPRTAYNLASYYTATQDYGEARLRLEAALELGIFTDAALTDEQLKPLRKADREAFDKLIDVYRARDATGLAAITAIGPELAAKLVAMGLDSAAKVIAAAASAEKRAQLAAQLDIGPGLVERWVRLLAMQQRVRIEARHLNLLEAANVNSLDALRRVTAKRLHELLEAVSGGRDVPKTSALQRWIEHASAAPQ